MMPSRPASRPLLLASASPYRRQLLAAAGLIVEARPAPVDEEAIRHADPRELARLRAEAKAVASARTLAEASGGLVIGADQVASLDGLPFGKAATRNEAFSRLSTLAGRTHVLHSAYAVVDAGTGAIRASRIVDVEMRLRPLSAGEIERYLDTGEWEGCVGCYQYENRGINLMERVGGDHSAIIGLPLVPLLDDLRRLGWNPLAD